MDKEYLSGIEARDRRLADLCADIVPAGYDRLAGWTKVLFEPAAQPRIKPDQKAFAAERLSQGVRPPNASRCPPPR